MPKTVFSALMQIPSTWMNKVFNHRHDGLDQDGSAPLDYAVDTGTADAYDIALTPAMTSSIAGLPIHFEAANSNTGASTLKVNEVAAVPIKKGYSFALEKGDIVAGQIVTVIFDGVNYQLLNTPKCLREGLYDASARVFNNGAPGIYQVIPNTAITGSFTGKKIKISLTVQGKNTGTLAHPLQIAIEVDGVQSIGFEAGPNTAGDGQWRTLNFDMIYYAGLIGTKTIQALCKVDAGAGAQITIDKTSIVVEE